MKAILFALLRRVIPVLADGIIQVIKDYLKDRQLSKRVYELVLQAEANPQLANGSARRAWVLTTLFHEYRQESEGRLRTLVQLAWERLTRARQ